MRLLPNVVYCIHTCRVRTHDHLFVIGAVASHASWFRLIPYAVFGSRLSSLHAIHIPVILGSHGSSGASGFHHTYADACSYHNRIDYSGAIYLHTCAYGSL